MFSSHAAIGDNLPYSIRTNDKQTKLQNNLYKPKSRNRNSSDNSIAHYSYTGGEENNKNKTKKMRQAIFPSIYRRYPLVTYMNSVLCRRGVPAPFHLAKEHKNLSCKLNYDTQCQKKKKMISENQGQVLNGAATMYNQNLHIYM